LRAFFDTGLASASATTVARRRGIPSAHGFPPRPSAAVGSSAPRAPARARCCGAWGCASCRGPSWFRRTRNDALPGTFSTHRTWAATARSAPLPTDPRRSGIFSGGSATIRCGGAFSIRFTAGFPAFPGAKRQRPAPRAPRSPALRADPGCTLLLGRAHLCGRTAGRNRRAARLRCAICFSGLGSTGAVRSALHLGTDPENRSTALLGDRGAQGTSPIHVLWLGKIATPSRRRFRPPAGPALGKGRRREVSSSIWQQRDSLLGAGGRGQGTNPRPPEDSDGIRVLTARGVDHRRPPLNVVLRGTASRGAEAS